MGEKLNINSFEMTLCMSTKKKSIRYCWVALSNLFKIGHCTATLDEKNRTYSKIRVKGTVKLA